MPLFAEGIARVGCRGAAEAASPDDNTSSAHWGGALREHPDTCWVVLVALCVLLAGALWNRRLVARAWHEAAQAGSRAAETNAVAREASSALMLWRKRCRQAIAARDEALERLREHKRKGERDDAIFAAATEARRFYEMERARAAAVTAAALHRRDVYDEERARAAAAIAEAERARVVYEVERERASAATAEATAAHIWCEARHACEAPREAFARQQ